MSKARTTYLIGGVILAILLVVTFMFIVSPRLAQASEIREQADKQEQANQLLQTKVANLNKTLARSGEIVTQGRSHADRFPPTAELPGLFADINRAAAQAGIPQKAIVTLTPASPTLIGSQGDDGKGAGLPQVAANASLAKMQLTLTVNSNYSQLVKFLKSLESLKRVYLLNGVNVATDSEKGYATNLVGDLFLMRQDELDGLLEQVQLLNGTADPAAPASTETVPAPVPSGAVPAPSGSPTVAPNPQSTTLKNLPGMPDIEITTAPPARPTPTP